MLWPIGQPPGERYTLARRSLEIWLKVLRDSGLWYEQTGSLHLAYDDGEAQVLRKFVAGEGLPHRECQLLGAARVGELSSSTWRLDGLLAAMWSATEVCVDPRQVAAEPPVWLTTRWGVRFFWEYAVIHCEPPRVVVGGRDFGADKITVSDLSNVHAAAPGLRWWQATGATACSGPASRSASRKP
jgi:hypothetical protein